MRPRFAGRFGLADAVTTTNAALGFCAVVAAGVDASLAARIVLVAAIADGLDGVVARKRGGTPAGEHLDSLADVASFAVAPAALVTAVAADPARPWSALTVAAVGLSALYVSMAVVRLGFYTAYDVGNNHTEGIPSTLAGTLLAAGVLVGAGPTVVVAATGVLAYLMITDLSYPDLLTRDALVMGALQALAIAFPRVASGVFPAALLASALAYLLLAPWLYWR